VSHCVRPTEEAVLSTGVHSFIGAQLQEHGAPANLNYSFFNLPKGQSNTAQSMAQDEQHQGFTIAFIDSRHSVVWPEALGLQTFLSGRLMQRSEVISQEAVKDPSFLWDIQAVSTPSSVS
jgi:hypothetical protein